MSDERSWPKNMMTNENGDVSPNEVVALRPNVRSPHISARRIFEGGPHEDCDEVPAAEQRNAAPPAQKGEVAQVAERRTHPATPASPADCGPGLSGPTSSDAAVVTIPFSHASANARASAVRDRLNAAVRPILWAFVRRRGLPLERFQDAIEGPAPLAESSIARHLGGALHCQEMRDAVASHADPALVPLKVRAGLTRMLARDLSDPPPVALQEDFPDWNKPLIPFGQRLQSWRAEDAASWLRHFPPNGCLLQPMNTWDAATASVWLNDREPVLDRDFESEVEQTVVAFSSPEVWRPSLEVLHTLEGLEAEALAYRVFRERLRREVMPSYVSDRRIQVRRAIESITFGYLTLEDARRSVRNHDLRRTEYLDRLFDTDQEWIHDLFFLIIASDEWPVGFAEPELWSDFSELSDPADSAAAQFTSSQNLPALRSSSCSQLD